jgi:hypothetical protein
MFIAHGLLQNPSFVDDRPIEPWDVSWSRGLSLITIINHQ